MSFDLNMAASSFKPKVENTFLGKGGGNGSTGYFCQRRKKNNNEQSILLMEDEGDILEKIGTEYKEDITDGNDKEGLIGKIKGFLKF